MAYVKRGNLEKLNIGSNDSRWDKYIKFANATIDNPSVPIDEKLDVHLRGNSVHIYYKGGRILEIKRNALNLDYNYFYSKNRHKAQRKAKFYINKCRSASCMQSGWKRTSA